MKYIYYDIKLNHFQIFNIYKKFLSLHCSHTIVALPHFQGSATFLETVSELMTQENENKQIKIILSIFF